MAEEPLDGLCCGTRGLHKHTALAGGNILAALMTAVHDLSLGQVTRALYEVGGQYRRNMWRGVPGQGSVSTLRGQLPPRARAREG